MSVICMQPKLLMSLALPLSVQVKKDTCVSMKNIHLPLKAISHVEINELMSTAPIAGP